MGNGSVATSGTTTILGIMKENIYKLTEQELRQYAYSCGLIGSCIDTLCRRVIYGESWTSIAGKTNYTYGGIMWHRKTILKKLGVQRI